jgi:anti-anti-sigma factor
MVMSGAALLAVGTTGWSGGGEVFTLFLEGELGAKEMAQLSDELFRLAQRGHRNVVVDLTDVSHLDYRGVRPLWTRAELFRKAGGDIKLCGLSPYLAAIFRAAGAYGAFEAYEKVDQARGAFERKENAA